MKSNPSSAMSDLISDILRVIPAHDPPNYRRVRAMGAQAAGTNLKVGTNFKIGQKQLSMSMSTLSRDAVDNGHRVCPTKLHHADLSSQELTSRPAPPVPRMFHFQFEIVFCFVLHICSSTNFVLFYCLLED